MKCNERFCPWVRHSRDSDRYLCLKCGTERNFEEQNLLVIGLTIAAIAVFLVVATGCSYQPENFVKLAPELREGEEFLQVVNEGDRPR